MNVDVDADVDVNVVNNNFNCKYMVWMEGTESSESVRREARVAKRPSM